VLYVHGFGKDFAESLDQAYALGLRYPDIEPVLFSWSAGDGEGFLQVFGAAVNATHRVNLAASQLSGVLRLFGEVSLPSDSNETRLKRVVLARSLGAAVLQQVMRESAGGDAHPRRYWTRPQQGIDRIVLSAAAAPKNGHRKAIDDWGIPTFVTINQRDQKLKLFDWAKFGATPLGLAVPSGNDRSARAEYYDCTSMSGVNTDHDYLFRSLNANLSLLHDELLTGASPSRTGFAPAGGASNVFVAA
jgi:hypothetical protein